jgi:Receptor family ligand binding region/WWE domain
LVNEFRKTWVGTYGHSVGHTDTILLDDVDNSKMVDPESVRQTLRDIPTDDPTVNSRIIFLAAHAEHAFKIIQEAHGMGFQPDTVWVGPSSWVGQTVSSMDWASWLPDIPGFIGVVPFRNDNDKVHSEFFTGFQAWQQREGKKPVLQELPTFAAETVDAIVAMTKALAETPAKQRRDGATVVERLRKIQFDGVSGRVEFTTNGDRKNPKYSIYNARTSTLNTMGDIVWTDVGTVEFVANITSASVADDVCFAQPAGCGLENIPDDTYPDNDKLPPWVPAVMAILCLLFIAVAFKYWRSRISKNSIKRTLEAFQNSIVDMKAAAGNYIPYVPNKEQALAGPLAIPPPVVRWCWKETAAAMQNHNAPAIYGDPADCWILYSDAQSQVLEAAYLAQQNECSPLTGYKVNLSAAMVQTKITTGYQRPVRRVVEPSPPQQWTTHDLSKVTIGDALPSDLKNEPQMVLVEGDVIQITKKRDDGWAFGTKLHHADEEEARRLVQAATDMAASDDDEVNGGDVEANIFPDSGWFPMTSTRPPSAEELKALKQKVASGTLDPPNHWAPTKDPTVAERHILYEGDMERSVLLKSFLSTLGGKNIQIVQVERIQNKAMFQSYIVKRQTICYRETGDGNGDSTVQQKAVQRFERRWLWHGTSPEVVDKIMNQVGTAVWHERKSVHNALLMHTKNRGSIGLFVVNTPRRMARASTLPATGRIRPTPRTVPRTWRATSIFWPAVSASENIASARTMP